MQSPYTIETHKHNFAVWTAARAVQRNFTNTNTIALAIETAQLHTEVQRLEHKEVSVIDFDKWHSEMSNKILKSLTLKPEDKREQYGRAAKIIAIYIKTYHILGNPTSSLSEFAHPPVDRILLAALFKKNKKLTKLNVADTAWTNLTEKDYFEVIDALRIIQHKHELKYFWMIESAWQASN